MRQEPRAGGRERHTTAVAVKERLVQFHFQQAHLAAQCRLRHAQHAGGTRETAEFGHLHEVGKLLEVHDLLSAPGRAAARRAITSCSIS